VTDAVALLAEIPLFAGFSAAELDRIAAHCDDRRYDKGTTVWEIGDPGDELLIVAQGELAVWGSDDVVAHLGPGSAVGEIALLLREPRSATVTATRPTRAFALSGADFDRFVRNDARAMSAVGEMLSRRLTLTTRRRSSTRHSLVVAVTARSRSNIIAIVAYALRDLLARDTGLPVLHADEDDLELTVAGPQSQLDAWRTFVESNRFPLVVLEVPAGEGRADPGEVARCVDVVVDIDGAIDCAAVPRHTRVHQLCVEEPRPAADVGGGAPFVVRLGPELLRLEARAAARAIVDAPSSPAARALGRLARTIQRRVVGLALGSGAALGLAHIGVLRELELAGIPIDVIAGSSMGAVIGVAYAAGAAGDELERTANNLSSFFRLLRSVDIAMTGDGLLAGKQLMQYLRPFYVGVETFDDLVLPARVVTTDITNGERFAIGEGPIDRALRASIAMPPFLSPVLLDDRTLVDGGIIDPIPCDVARELGADIVIGVSAIPRLQAGNATVLTRMSRSVNRLNPLAYFGGRLRSLNLLDIVMNSFQVVEHELSRYVGRSAEVFIQPDLGSRTWIEFYRAPEIISSGAGAAVGAIPAIERVLADRLSQFAPDGSPHTGARLADASSPELKAIDPPSLDPPPSLDTSSLDTSSLDPPSLDAESNGDDGASAPSGRWSPVA
jgi:NTE family protein